MLVRTTKQWWKKYTVCGYPFLLTNSRPIAMACETCIEEVNKTSTKKITNF